MKDGCNPSVEHSLARTALAILHSSLMWPEGSFERWAQHALRQLPIGVIEQEFKALQDRHLQNEKK